MTGVQTCALPICELEKQFSTRLHVDGATYNSFDKMRKELIIKYGATNVKVVQLNNEDNGQSSDVSFKFTGQSSYSIAPVMLIRPDTITVQITGQVERDEAVFGTQSTAYGPQTTTPNSRTFYSGIGCAPKFWGDATCSLRPLTLAMDAEIYSSNQAQIQGYPAGIQKETIFQLLSDKVIDNNPFLQAYAKRPYNRDVSSDCNIMTLPQEIVPWKSGIADQRIGADENIHERRNQNYRILSQSYTNGTVNLEMMPYAINGIHLPKAGGAVVPYSYNGTTGPLPLVETTILEPNYQPILHPLFGVDLPNDHSQWLSNVQSFTYKFSTSQSNLNGLFDSSLSNYFQFTDIGYYGADTNLQNNALWGGCGQVISDVKVTVQGWKAYLLQVRTPEVIPRSLSTQIIYNRFFTPATYTISLPGVLPTGSIKGTQQIQLQLNKVPTSFIFGSMYLGALPVWNGKQYGMLLNRVRGSVNTTDGICDYDRQMLRALTNQNGHYRKFQPKSQSIKCSNVYDAMYYRLAVQGTPNVMKGTTPGTAYVDSAGTSFIYQAIDQPVTVDAMPANDYFVLNTCDDIPVATLKHGTVAGVVGQYTWNFAIDYEYDQTFNAGFSLFVIPVYQHMISLIGASDGSVPEDITFYTATVGEMLNKFASADHTRMTVDSSLSGGGLSDLVSRFAPKVFSALKDVAVNHYNENKEEIHNEVKKKGADFLKKAGLMNVK